MTNRSLGRPDLADPSDPYTPSTQKPVSSGPVSTIEVVPAPVSTIEVVRSSVSPSSLSPAPVRRGLSTAFGPYRSLLAVAGGNRCSSAAFLARLPSAMLGVSVVLLLTARGFSYGLAGAIAASGAAASGVGQPFTARIMDRRGQRRLLPVLAVASSALLVGFVAIVYLAAPTWALFAMFMASGLTQPNVFALVRARWSFVLSRHLASGFLDTAPNKVTIAAEDALVQTAYAWESVVDEIVYVLGPLLATVLTLQVASPMGLLAAAVFTVLGSVLLALHVASEPQAHPRATGARTSWRAGAGGALRYRGVKVVTVVFVLIGFMFGTMEIVTVAFASERGARGIAGLLLALYALGSGAAGLAVGAMTWRIRPQVRLRRAAIALTITLLPVPLSPNLAVLGILLFAAGLAVSATLIPGFAYATSSVPRGKVTEALSWATSGLSLGFAIGISVAGASADRYGAQHSFWLAVSASAAALLLAQIGTRGKTDV